MPHIQAVCLNYHKLPDQGRLHFKSSLSQMCTSDWDYNKVCVDQANAQKVCSDGKSINRDLCQMYPDKCQDKKSCANDVYGCLARSQVDNYYCQEFPELCMLKFKDGKELINEVCSIQNGILCTNGLPSVNQICHND